MARPKGSINKAKDTQGVEEAKITDTPLKGTPVEVEPKTVTTVKSVQVEEVEPTPLKKGDLFLLVVNGSEGYWTKSQAIMMLQRNSHDIEIPKGSSFVAPINSKCKGCG